jgi:hypothetical protein
MGDLLGERLDQVGKLDFTNLTLIIAITAWVFYFRIIISIDFRTIQIEFDSAGSGVCDLAFEEGDYRKWDEEEHRHEDSVELDIVFARQNPSDPSAFSPSRAQTEGVDLLKWRNQESFNEIEGGWAIRSASRTITVR